MLGKRSLYFWPRLIGRFSLISCRVGGKHKQNITCFILLQRKTVFSKKFLPNPPCPPLTTGDRCVIFSLFLKYSLYRGSKSNFPDKMLHYFCRLQKVKSKVYVYIRQMFKHPRNKPGNIFEGTTGSHV